VITAEFTRLTAPQRRIVEWGEGPLVVIAGAGTGKTRVIVERVRYLLETKGDATVDEKGHLRLPPVGETPKDDPFTGPLMPEQILVLTYNVKAAKQLADRLETAVGPGAAARLNVGNFHSFCNRVLTESAADAGLPAQPDVLDGINQILLLRDIRPNLPLVYHGGGSNPHWWLDQFVGFINRAKDELVTPDDFDAFVAGERAAFESRYGSYDRALERLDAQGNLNAQKSVRGAYADFRRRERADEAGEPDANPDYGAVKKAADREARRTIAGDGKAHGLKDFRSDQVHAIDQLAHTYVVDGAALEVLRLSELGLVYHAYQDELARRGALDFGEQISAVTRLFKHRPKLPAPLPAPVPLPARGRVPGREHRPDRAHRAPRPHAGPAGQRHGRRRRRPIDLPFPRRELLGVRRVPSRNAPQSERGADYPSMTVLLAPETTDSEWGSSEAPSDGRFRFVDLFAGIGGIRLGLERAGGRCVYTVEIDRFARQTYEANFGPVDAEDVRLVDPRNLPPYDVLAAGFPCQPFSIAGVSKKASLGREHGFADETSGNLFFEIVRIADRTRPSVLLLENVKNLRSHDGGRTFATILRHLRQIGYEPWDGVVNATAWVPQHRERTFIIARRVDTFGSGPIDVIGPPAGAGPRLGSILESDVPSRYQLSDALWHYLQAYAIKHRAAGHGFGYRLFGPDDVSGTLSARYYKDGAEILIRTVAGPPRRLTPVECARLMGFPNPRQTDQKSSGLFRDRSEFVIPVSDRQAYKQFGNSVVVPVIHHLGAQVASILDRTRTLV
jgi:DNA (cytosine-5)-methyltransferase 1